MLRTFINVFITELSGVSFLTKTREITSRNIIDAFAMSTFVILFITRVLELTVDPDSIRCTFTLISPHFVDALTSFEAVIIHTVVFIYFTMFSCESNDTIALE